MYKKVWKVWKSYPHRMWKSAWKRVKERCRKRCEAVIIRTVKKDRNDNKKQRFAQGKDEGRVSSRRYASTAL